MDYWSPDPQQGRFTVVSGEAADGAQLLAAERAAGGAVTVERDERAQPGVRRLRFRVHRQEPREVLVGDDGETRHVGDVPTEHLSEFLLLHEGARAIRAGYTVRTDADPSLRALFAEVLDRVEIDGDG